MALDLSKIKHNLEETLTKYGEVIVQEINRQLSNNGIKKTDNIKFNIKETNSVISLEISIPDYVNYVNSGRKKGSMPPIDEIVKWVISKDIQPIRKTGSLPKKSKTSLVDKQRAVAFVIAKSIAEKGIKAKKIIDPAIDKAMKGINQDIPNDVNGPMADIITQILKDSFVGQSNVKVTK